MKKLILSALSIMFLFPACSKDSENIYATQEDPNIWSVVWEENFEESDIIDSRYWTKIPRGRPEWQKYMSSHNDCYDVKDGTLILRGIPNNMRATADTAIYLTGGIFSKGKKSFTEGKVSVRAKMNSVQGSWPAIWMLPDDDTKWPFGGEIDIMERPNDEKRIYQTIHSHYSYNLGFIKNPPNGGSIDVDPTVYNTYSVIFEQDKLLFMLNDKVTFVYPRIETDQEGQFPFNDHSYYLLIDMQLGGYWVGDINSDQLPSIMTIDWVRYYKKKEVTLLN